MNLSAAILAGGQSSRMGRDKALLVLNRQRLIDRLVQEFSASCSEIVISAAHQDDYKECGVPVVADEFRGIGPIEGIRQSLLFCSFDHVFVCAVDTPFVRREMMLYLAEFISSDYDAVVFCEKDRIHPLCGIYSKAVLPAIQDLIAERQYRLTELLSRVRTKYVDISLSCFGRETLRNINTPDDYRAIRRPMLFCVSGVKNSGKTHLVERLIHAFAKRGMSVGVIKHDGHSFDCDIEGTDSDRFYRAGAMAAAVFSDSQSFLRVRRQAEIDELLWLMGDVDVVMIEGMKHSSYPKVEVIRAETRSAGVCDSGTLLCIATDAPLAKSVPCPVYDLNDTEGILDCILEKQDLCRL